MNAEFCKEENWSFLSKEAQDLIDKLICVNPQNRLSAE
jgi:serine/threonine protein kinase